MGTVAKKTPGQRRITIYVKNPQLTEVFDRFCIEEDRPATEAAQYLMRLGIQQFLKGERLSWDNPPRNIRQPT